MHSCSSHLLLWYSCLSYSQCGWVGRSSIIHGVCCSPEKQLLGGCQFRCLFKSQISLSHLCLFGITVFPVVGLLYYLHFSQERWRAIWIWCAAKAGRIAHRIKIELPRIGNIKPFNRYESSSGVAFSQHTVPGKLGSTEVFKGFSLLGLASTARLMLQLSEQAHYKFVTLAQCVHTPKSGLGQSPE